MRLWSYQILDVLPDKMLIAEWRECVAIKRQWEKGTLKHRLVSYVMDYDRTYFRTYVRGVVKELKSREINVNFKLYDEIWDFCSIFPEPVGDTHYPEHNDRYLRECLYNLEEKATRGIITKQEWQKIYNKYKDKFDLWDGEE